MITLQFSSNNSIYHKAIEWFQWSQFAHVDFVLPDGNLLGARPSRGVGIYPPLDPRESTNLIMHIPFSDAVLDKARTQIGKPYDWAGVLGFPFRGNWQQTDKWFCSELVAWAMVTKGIPVVNQETWRVTPRDLLMALQAWQEGHNANWI